MAARLCGSMEYTNRKSIDLADTESRTLSPYTTFWESLSNQLRLKRKEYTYVESI